jgi:hypothetical protein
LGFNNTNLHLPGDLGCADFFCFLFLGEEMSALSLLMGDLSRVRFFLLDFRLCFWSEKAPFLLKGLFAEKDVT